MSTPGPRRRRITSLAELGTVRDTLQRQAREAALQAARAQAAQRERQRAQQAQHDLFARSVGPVHPLRHHGKAELDLPRPAPHPRMREADEAAALAASLSDEVTLESLLLTDDGLSFRRPGIGPDVVAKLRRGHWALQGQIDLHGYTRDEARDLLAGSRLDMETVAERAGFGSTRQLRRAWGRIHDAPPSRMRGE